MDESDLTKEKRAMAMMRQVLSAVARDTVPPPGMKHPLNDETIKSIRDCLAYLAARERELGISLGQENNAKPRFVDEPKTSSVIPLDSITRKNKDL